MYYNHPMKPEINWAKEIDYIDIKNYQSIEKQIEIEGSLINYKVHILNGESHNWVVNIPGVGINGLKDLQNFSKAFDSEPFFNVITFSNPNPYTPEIVSEGVCKMLSNVDDEIEAVILHADSQGGVATWKLLSDGVLEKFPVKGIVFQAPIISKENMSSLLKFGTNRLYGLIGKVVQDGEKWKQEMDSAFNSNIIFDSNVKLRTPVLLVRFDKDKLIDYSATETVLKKSFLNIKGADFKSNKSKAGHDTDDWSSVMKTEVKFMADCFSQK